MKPIRFINFCLLAITFSSCTTVRYTQNIVSVTPKKDIIVNKIGKDIVYFRLNSLLVFNDTLFPVITRQTANGFDSWIANTANEPVYQEILSEKTYSYWQQTVQSLVRKHSTHFESLIFSIPGRMIAYTEDYQYIEHLNPRPDCALMGLQPDSKRYYENDIKDKPSNMKDYPERYVFRTVKKDFAHGMLLAIDRIYLNDSNKILCLMYLCTGKGDYICDSEWKRRYDNQTPFTTFNPLRNIPMAFDFFYRQCDPISVNALNSLRDKWHFK